MSPRLRARERLLLAAGVGVVAAMLVALLGYPLIRKVGRAHLNALHMRDELAQATALAQQRQGTEQRYAAAKQAGEALLVRIPTDPDLPDLLLRLDQAMELSGVRLEQLTFLNEAPPAAGAQGGSGLVGSMPVQLRVRGTYPQVRTLVQALEESPRLVVIDRMALAGGETGLIAADFALRALFLR